MSLADLRISRQKAILGAGLGLIATALAACTTYGKKPEASGASATPTAEATPGTGAAGPAAQANAIAKT
ncbi:MAG TPA: Rieske (2Fe-2S) protein, partial [Mycobacterium sp.]|nr:Rieske (2Fe-2S) protein [Mycobacterium sp.]